ESERKCFRFDGSETGCDEEFAVRGLDNTASIEVDLGIIAARLIEKVERGAVHVNRPLPRLQNLEHPFDDPVVNDAGVAAKSWRHACFCGHDDDDTFPIVNFLNMPSPPGKYQ